MIRQNESQAEQMIAEPPPIFLVPFLLVPHLTPRPCSLYRIIVCLLSLVDSTTLLWSLFIIIVHLQASLRSFASVDIVLAPA